MELKAHPFFQGISEEEVKELIDAAREIEYPSNTIIFEEGSAPDCLYLVLEGTIAFCKRFPEGDFRTISFADEGSFFGEIGLFTGQPRALRAETRDKVKVAVIPDDKLLQFIRSTSGPVEQILQSIINHLHSTTRHYIEDMLKQEKMAVVGSMMNTIIHDFKNPFCLISLGAQLMMQMHKDEKTLRICNNIEQQIKRMVAMAEELAEFSRGQSNLNLGDVHLPELMDKFRELNAPYFQNGQISIDIKVPHVTVEAEENKMIRLFQNLVGNAIDAIGEGKGRISICGEANNGTLYLQVRDTGNGIPEAIRGRFFEPFVTYGKSKGTGLGSAIVQSIVHAHRGEIKFETETGKGTTFFIALPLRQEDAAVYPRPLAQP